MINDGEIILSRNKDGWFKLGYLMGDNILFRAISIKKNKKRPSDRGNQHKGAEATAKGSVKMREKSYYNIKNFN